MCMYIYIYRYIGVCPSRCHVQRPKMYVYIYIYIYMCNESWKNIVRITRGLCARVVLFGLCAGLCAGIVRRGYAQGFVRQPDGCAFARRSLCKSIEIIVSPYKSLQILTKLYKPLQSLTDRSQSY